MASGAGRTQGQATEPERGFFEEAQLAFLDFDTIYFELQRFKNERAWHNLNVLGAERHHLICETTDLRMFRVFRGL